ncbi:uncharacterized protein PHALS_12929 [Plasmopara halstedii]|uniref:Uncharacterized protein n=1 Tax=Plasmopara halstedii TaxID=4781 RepID=A0A0P1AMR8_PLAHL|nr:uncharacterized protein PHALS_12929 [Plasmopara halstedii]CEG42673.1 hypothetical protein PHALS_12929 [Plasmopara halstedii]|eukprot:XP_024579042.1 hypothetical protein PHALS_12929 [Plasmopara halstedii]
MKSQTLQRVQELSIPVKKWGQSDYRVKVRAARNRLTYTSKITTPENIKLVAEHYNMNEDEQSNYLLEERKEAKYVRKSSVFIESHLYEHIDPNDFYNKLEEILKKQNKSYKVNAQLGYTLIDDRYGDEPFEYYYSPDSTSLTNPYQSIQKLTLIPKS